MQFPMSLKDRMALTAIADELMGLQQRSADLGLDFLALVLSHAREEACDRLRDDTSAKRDRIGQNVVNFCSTAGASTIK